MDKKEINGSKIKIDKKKSTTEDNNSSSPSFSFPFHSPLLCQN
jgi:hypothetical protein